MSVVDRILWRHGLRWELNPYRVVVDSHPHLVVQTGPRFDLRESVLKGTRERVLATERKRRQRAKVQDVTPMPKYNTSIESNFAVLGRENAEVLSNLPSKGNHG